MHGNSEGEQRFYDESLERSYNEFLMNPIIAKNSDYWQNSLVLSEPCHAARINNVKFNESIALQILTNGALGYVGETSYSEGIAIIPNLDITKKLILNKELNETEKSFLQTSINMNIKNEMNYLILENIKNIKYYNTIGEIIKNTFLDNDDVYYGDPTIRLKD